MRTVVVLSLGLLAVCAGCTYDIPGVASNPSDGAGPAEASVDDSSGGDDASLDAGDVSAGHDADAGNTDAACTGGVLCACNNVTDCSSGICALAVDIGADLGHANFCTQPCCTSQDCSSGSVCFASGQGGNYCVDPAWLGRSTPGGNAIGGATCTSGTSCRSGLCVNSGAAKVCADTCCSFGATGGECASGSQCAFGSFPGTPPDSHFAARCGPPGGANQAGSPCAQSSQCAGGLCYTNTTTAFYCVQPCSTSGDCDPGYACQLDVQDGDLYAGCFSTPSGGPQGAACDNFQQCLGGLCNEGQCTNLCFTDTACTVSGWSCKPQQDDSYPPGDPTVLACGP
jgi:hypothetical protein